MVVNGNWMNLRLLVKEVKMYNTLQIVGDTLVSGVQTSHAFNWWMLIAIVELLIIIVLLLSKSKSNDKKRIIKKRVKMEGDIDFGNIIDSSFNAAKLYKDIITQCHPDRFEPDKDKVAIANDISLRLGKYKNDVKMLNEIKQEAIEKLNVNFKN